MRSVSIAPYAGYVAKNGCTTPLALLDQLFADQTRFVIRSVANHINDIAEIDPDLAVATLTRWKAAQTQTPAEIAYIIRHALRSLVKDGVCVSMK